MGVAAMLKNQWTDMTFSVASLADRKPVSEDDDLVIVAAPDPQGTPSSCRVPCMGHPLKASQALRQSAGGGSIKSLSKEPSGCKCHINCTLICCHAGEMMASWQQQLTPRVSSV